VITTFIIEFKEHLAPAKIANLKGILEGDGIGREQSGKFGLEVSRKSRVSFVAIQLNNWTAYGWLTWTSDPRLEPFDADSKPRR
jgi:hypothetical protein